MGTRCAHGLLHSNTMKFRFLFPIFAIVFSACLGAFGQGTAPRQEKLLNGLKLLIWNDPSADKVTLRVRVHAGSAFDPQGKEGVMALLAQNIFPNEAAREYFQDLGGDLSIARNYDYIQIDASAKPDEFLAMIEAVSSAISNIAIDKETTAKLKTAAAAKLAELEKDPSYIADRAVAKRLFGTFPYGRPEIGPAESLAKIDFADLIEAKQRFLTADNATVTISGKLDPAIAYRSARRYLGAWLKSDKTVPSTFKQPDEPDTKPEGIATNFAGDSQMRYALRGLARNDKDYVAGLILTSILNERIKQFLPEGTAVNGLVRHEAHILPGMLVFSYTSPLTGSVYSAPVASAGARPAGSPNMVTLLLSQSIRADEFAAAKSKVSAMMNGRDQADVWLDADTYKLASPADDRKALDAVTQADVQRVALKLAGNPVVAVSVFKAEEKTTSN